MRSASEKKGTDMNKVGVFICNYNKADFVVKCVESVKGQTFRDLDILVVDNASTDDSVQKLRQRYGEEVTIIQNEENLGGSGGFGRGIRTALDMGYPYFMLIDNDAVLDSHAVEHLYRYMEAHGDTGICGAEILCMQHPDKIQDLGGRLDMQEYCMGGVISGLAELSGNVILECDYVASCAVMARTDAVRKFGGFPEENFIYWDDVEWCTKCWKAGFQVVVNSKAKAYHDFSDRNIRNMFSRYYMNRNRYKFFTKYLPEEKLEDFYQKITREFFHQNYAAMNKGKYGTVLTAWNALDDFLHGITGKARDGILVPYAEGTDRLAERVAASDSALIFMPCHAWEDYHCLNQVLRYLMRHRKELQIMVTFHLEDDTQGRTVIHAPCGAGGLRPIRYTISDDSLSTPSGECITGCPDGYHESDFDLVFELCRHVTEIKENVLPRIYIDQWRNYVLDEDDYQYFSNYGQNLQRFQEMYRPLFVKQVKELRKRMDSE